MAETRWIRVRPGIREGRRCRVLDLADDAGSLLLEVVAFPWARDIVATPAPGVPVQGFVIRRRRLFPLTGALDVLALRDHAPLGVLNRSGSVRAADGNRLGRFRDARTLGDWAGESAFELVGQVLTDAGGGDAGRMPSERRWMLDGKEQGRLRRAKWPFATAEVPEDAVPRGFRRFLPRRFVRFARSLAEPATWRFDWHALESRVAPQLPLAAAVWAVELSYW